MAIFWQFSAYQSWQAPSCLHFLHRYLLEILLFFSPKEFCRSRFLSDRGKTTGNPDGFTRILTKSGQKSARQNRVRIYSRLLNTKFLLNALTNLLAGYFAEQADDAGRLAPVIFGAPTTPRVVGRGGVVERGHKAYRPDMPAEHSERRRQHSYAEYNAINVKVF